MKTVTISTYSLRVKSGAQGTYYELRRLPRRRNILSLLGQYLLKLKKQTARDEDNHVLFTASHLLKTPHSISAFLERGEYGITSDLLDVRKKIVRYQRSVDDAEMMPFYFLAAIPADGNRGVVAFQIESNSSIRAQFKIGFEDYLRQKCGDCDLELEKLVPDQMVQEYVRNERVAKLRFLKIKVPSDISEVFRGANLEEDATIELQVKAKPGSDLRLAKRINSILSGRREVSEFVQIRGFDYDAVKVEFNVHGKRRTIDLSNRNNFRADYDISDRAVIIDGHPTFASVDPIAREIVRDIMDSLGMKTDGV
jgi:hypothetical protein